MPQDILDRLARIDELTDDELAALESDLVDGFDAADESHNVDLMGEFHDAITRVRGTQSAREEEAAAAEERAAELRSAIHPVDSDEDGDEETEETEDDAAETTRTGDGGEDEEDNDAVNPAEVVPPATDRRAASARGTATASATGRRTAGAPARPALGTASNRTGSRSPRRAPKAQDTGRARLFAQRPVGALQTGDEISDRETLAAAMTDVIHRLGRGDGEARLVASARWEFPEERRLGSDVNENTRKIDAVTSPTAIVASGGICNPVDVDFSLPMILSVDDEPLGDALPTFGATRGGLRYMQPPTFSGVGAGATTVWTEATDANPGTATKPVQKVVCGTEEEVYVDAIPTRLQFGNMTGRFYPEMVAANTDLAMANAARVRELNRLSKISAASTVVSSGQLLGAARDLLATLDQAAAAYRYRSRLNRQVQMRAVLPDWVKDLVRADLLREMAHGQDVSESFSLTDAQVDQLLTSRGISPIWLLDGQQAGSANGISWGVQGFGAQGAGAALLDWPHTVQWWLFAEGTFQRLDGGRLDIGVVRDSTLDSTNDYQTFVETFEGIALRGFESLEIVSTVRPNGLSAGTVSTTTY